MNKAAITGSLLLATALAAPACAGNNSVPHAQRPPILNEQYTIVDAPGAGVSAGQGTTVYAINAAGFVTGTYIDASQIAHGFLRAPDGTYTEFDAPEHLTIPLAINAGNGITGEDYTEAFVRSPKGKITGFGCSGSSYSEGDGINRTGSIAGGCSTDRLHGVLRAKDGSIVEIDAPDSGNYGTWANSINDAGAVAGYYGDDNTVLHGFLRSVDGTIAEFDAAGAGTGSFQGTMAKSINKSGWIAGIYIDSNGFDHGFLRNPNGNLTKFDAPHAKFTDPEKVNAGRVVAGALLDKARVSHGFIRSKSGSFTTFDAPGAGTGSNQGTSAYDINDSGVVAGTEIDGNDVNHGFIRMP